MRSVPDVCVCATESRGLGALIDAAVGRLSDARQRDRALLGTTAARCRDSLDGALAALARAEEAAAGGAGEELVAVEIREALERLGEIVGAVYTDDLLDRVFSRFCIGK